MKQKNNSPIYQIFKMSIFSISLLTLVFSLACSSGDSQTDEMPSNLVLEVAISGANDSNPAGDGSGKVTITAKANNATKYAFRIDAGDLIENQNGTLEHQFIKDGTNSYNITAWAYSSNGKFITETVSVEVFKSDEQFTNLIFFDDFEYEGRPDAEKWHHQIIPPDNGSWHNGELQHYTDRAENSFVSDGTLKIKAIKEQYTYNGSTKAYTSARLNSKV